MKIDPKDFDPIVIQRKLREMGIDMATLERVAKTIEKEIPELKAVLRKHAGKESFESGVEGAYEEIKNIFDHDEVLPDDKEK